MKVILPCNTRKWSSGFLCIARILQLQHYLIAMAARDDLESENFILPDFQLLEYARSALFEFYLVEQLLQRDSANVIHLSFFWYSISTKVKQTVINLRQKGFHPEANALEEKNETTTAAYGRVRSVPFVSYLVARDSKPSKSAKIC